MIDPNTLIEQSSNKIYQSVIYIIIFININDAFKIINLLTY